MITQLFGARKGFTLEREYSAPPAAVWEALTRPELLRQWWGPENTTVTDCEIDLKVGGRIYVVMRAGEGMGKYAGTIWPMEGTFTRIEEGRRLAYDARSWTQGEEATATIEHVNDLTLTATGATTSLALQVRILRTGQGARMAAFGMKWGYKAHLDNLGALLSNGEQARD